MAVDMLRLGSRESPLALAQAHSVQMQLQQRWPQLQIEIKTFKTQGDRILDRTLSKVGDKGLFVKELEVALLLGEIDFAVHSLKDMPGELPPELALLSFGAREEAGDVLLSMAGLRFEDLPSGAVVGTSSLRREAQLRRLRADVHYEMIRGNLQTRYQKMADGRYDAIVLAAAGVNRLGWQERVTQTFDPWEQSIPAVGQGILGVEFRRDDCRLWDYLLPLTWMEVEMAQRAERAVLSALAGGCQLPLGAYCRVGEDGQGEMKGVVLSPDGETAVYAELMVNPEQPEESGRALATVLLDEGAREILDAVRVASVIDPA